MTMRLTILFYGVIHADTQLEQELTNQEIAGYYGSLFEDVKKDTNLQRFYQLFHRIVKERQIQLAGELSSAYFVVRRGVDTDSPPVAYRLESMEDVKKLVEDDYIHVFFRPNAGEPPPADTPFVQAYSQLPLLRTTQIKRVLTHAEELIAALDDIDPVCKVERSIEPAPVALDQLAHFAQQPWSDQARIDYANEVHANFQKCGFLRLRFTDEQMTLLNELSALQRQFFDLPQEEKMKSGPYANQDSSYQIPFGYSVKRECNKEFFVVRQPPTHVSHHGPRDFSLPPNPPRFADVSMRVFRMLGQICQELMTLLLQSIHIPREKIETLLHNSMAPPSYENELGYTSVIELFHYSVPPSENESESKQKEAAEQHSSTSTAMASSAASTTSRPIRTGPLPCSIHSDASLLTLIPRCIGTPGLQLLNMLAYDWQSVEAQSAPNEAIVFPGDMYARLTNDDVQPCQHRVVFQPEDHTQAATKTTTPTTSSTSSSATTGDTMNYAGHRYSYPFELFLAPQTRIDCTDLFSTVPEAARRPIHAECQPIETAQAALATISRGRISVNKTHLN